MSEALFLLLRIGGVEFATPVALAPVADVTDAVFRDMCLEFSRQGLPVELVRPEMELGKRQATHETEMVTATCNVTMSANRSTVATQAHIKVAIDAAPCPNVSGKTQMEGMFVGGMVTAKALQMGSAWS